MRTTCPIAVPRRTPAPCACAGRRSAVRRPARCRAIPLKRSSILRTPSRRSSNPAAGVSNCAPSPRATRRCCRPHGSRPPAPQQLYRSLQPAGLRRHPRHARRRRAPGARSTPAPKGGSRWPVPSPPCGSRRSNWRCIPGLVDGQPAILDVPRSSTMLTAALGLLHPAGLGRRQGRGHSRLHGLRPRWRAPEISSERREPACVNVPPAPAAHLRGIAQGLDERFQGMGVTAQRIMSSKLCGLVRRAKAAEASGCARRISAAHRGMVGTAELALADQSMRRGRLCPPDRLRML